MDDSPLARAVKQLDAGRSLNAEECRCAMAFILDGGEPETEVASFLAALHRKGESADELLGATRAIRERMITFDAGPAPGDRLDTCGTGGDGADTVNVSTATAVVVAACGLRVVKHGNRAASSRSGSSDVLERLGVAIDVDLPVLRRCFAELGLVFLFAPRFHPGLRGVAAVRRQLPHRTIFNLVGPLCNPASPTHQLLGVPRDDHAATMAWTLARSGTILRAAVVTGSDGLDEVTLDGPTRVRVVEQGAIRETEWMPDDFGLGRVRAELLRVSGPEESARRLRDLFQGEPGPVRDVVLANAAAAIWTVEQGLLPHAVARAAAAIDSGAALRRLERWAEITRGTR